MSLLFGFVKHFFPTAKQKHPTNGCVSPQMFSNYSVLWSSPVPASALEEFYPHHTRPAGSRYKRSGRWSWGGASDCAPGALHDVLLCRLCHLVQQVLSRLYLKLLRARDPAMGKQIPVSITGKLDLLTLPLKVKQGSSSLEAPTERETAPQRSSQIGWLLMLFPV